jgi:hypothetical protein
MLVTVHKQIGIILIALNANIYIDYAEDTTLLSYGILQINTQ